MEDKKYPIELEVITPLSVGAGNDNDWMRGIDFIQKDGKVYVLDIKKAVEQGVDIDRLTSLFNNYDEKGISLLIGNKLPNVSRLVFDAPVSTTNAIKTFLRTQLYGKPIVAGSSIKGSLRSALFNYLRDNESTNEEVFGNMKDGTDLMHFIRIADIEMPSTSLVNTKIFNLRKEGAEWLGGWKHGMSETTRLYRADGFNTLYECVLPNHKGFGSISLAGRAFEVMTSNTSQFISHKEKKNKLMGGGINGLFHIINQVTRTYLMKERVFFEKYLAERSEELIDNVNALLKLIPDDDSYCLLKMSAGVGFHSITGDWQFNDYNQTGNWTEGRNAGKKKFKSRKTADYNGHLQLMGFVKLRALDADKANQYAQSLDEDHAEIIDSIVTSARQREEERLKHLEEERQRQLAIEKEHQKERTCQDLLEQAEQYYNENLWDEAIAKAEAAAEIFPGRSEVVLMIEKCKQAKELEEYHKNVQAADTQKFSQPLAEVIKGKTSAGNLVGTTVKWLKVEGNSFGLSEREAFAAEARLLPSKEWRKLKAKMADLAKVTGKEETDKLYNELGIA